MSGSPAPSALRTALRATSSPRGILALVVVVVCVVATILLGRWQWDRTQAILAAERASQAQRVPIAQVLPVDAVSVPAEALGHPVTLSGTWDPTAQVAVTQREVQGRPGVWILTALRLDTGGAVAVLRGGLPTPTSPGAVPPTGHVEVEGVIQQEETFYAGATSAPGTVVALAGLSTALGTPVLPGYVQLTAQRPSVTPAPVVLPAPEPPDVPFPLRNFVYALQWWIFGVFAIALFVRWLWRRPQDDQGAAADPAAGDRLH